ncbi:MAG TPA: hypothetical protein VFQ53_11125 [Kofleriaceae bacterium]|nr:hypothetical protein [Kofleriaceae bacterium]
MRPTLRIIDDKLELPRPIAATLAAVAEHLPERPKKTLERLACLDRDRARGEHVFELAELLELFAVAHALLVDPPIAIRRTRRITAGPLPMAERVGEVLAWIHERRTCEAVIYELWGHSSVSS